jgi:signal peptidase I
MSDKVRYTLLGLLLAGVLALIPFRPLKITGQSMAPTLRNGETYVLDHLYWKPAGLRRGDIVVVNHRGEKWVKRLVGMPGDLLQITYQEDGWIADIANLSVDASQKRNGGEMEERKVAPDEIYVVGDNLNRSLDSTNQEAGAFKLKDIIGIVRTFTLRRDFPLRR